MRGKSNGSFLLFLAGQGVLNLGEAIRFIAVTVLIYKLSGSGMTAAAGAAIAALPSIIGSPFSGVLGDRMNESRILIATDIVRFFTVPLFLYANKVSFIYLLLVVISLLDVIYGPSRKKFILGLTGKDKALEANSRLIGVSGAAYLVGPMLAGMLTDLYGPAPAIIIAALCCLVSCIMTTTAVAVCGGYKGIRGYEAGGRKDSFASQLLSGIGYCRSADFIRELLIIGVITGFCTISVNLSFYPFAFDVLSVTAKGWSLMVTVYYGTNLIAMLLVGCFDRKRRRKSSGGALFYLCLALVSVIWLQYSYVRSYPAVLLLQFVEGTAIAVCGILSAARYQKHTDRRFMARVSGIGDIAGSVGRLAGMGCTALITWYFRFSDVFIASGILLLVFVLVSLTNSVWMRNDQ